MNKLIFDRILKKNSCFRLLPTVIVKTDMKIIENVCASATICTHDFRIKR